MHKISTRLLALGLATLALTTACGEDNILEPVFGEGCNRGSLAAGQMIEGSLSTASCRNTYHWDSDGTTPYESWSVHLDAGKAYMFYMQQVPDSTQNGLNAVDPILTLWGKDDQGRSVPLAASDDEAGGLDDHNSEFWFVAPRSGDFQLVAASYSWTEFGGYRLQMQSCPVLGTMDTAGTYTFVGQHSTCIRHESVTDEDLPSAYTFVSFKADAFEEIEVTVVHDNSDAQWEIGGPGFDTYANIYDETEYDYGYYNGSTSYIEMDEIPGRLTVALATTDFDAAGTFTVTLGRTPATAPTPAPWHDGRFTLRSTFPKAEAKRLAKP